MAVFDLQATPGRQRFGGFQRFGIQGASPGWGGFQGGIQGASPAGLGGSRQSQGDLFGGGRGLFGLTSGGFNPELVYQKLLRGGGAGTMFDPLGNYTPYLEELQGEASRNMATLLGRQRLQAALSPNIDPSQAAYAGLLGESQAFGGAQDVLSQARRGLAERNQEYMMRVLQMLYGSQQERQMQQMQQEQQQEQQGNFLAPFLRYAGMGFGSAFGGPIGGAIAGRIGGQVGEQIGGQA